LARAFARTGARHEWIEYLAQLVKANGCGIFLPHASFVVPGETPASAGAATVVTHLSEGTVHLAQIAVAPAARGRGLARRLIAASLSASATAGYTRATLLVGGRNLIARHLYEQLGFEEVAMFVSAVCDQPRRFTSAALETGDGAVITGCNIETATYGLTIFAERVAMYKALSEGHRVFTRIAIVADTEAPTPPCGACRQILWEFGGNLEIQLANLPE